VTDVVDAVGDDDRDDDREADADADEGAPRRRRGGRPRKQTKSADDVLAEGGEQKQMTLDELEAVATIQKGLPKPAENVKSLGEMLAKYGVGSNPDFQIALWRTSPKYHKNVKIDGFYGRFDHAISEEFILATYGGGVYSVRIEGPHPSKPGERKHYDSLPLNLPGDPLLDNVPHKVDASAQGVAPMAPVPAAAEHPKVVEAALGMLSKQAENEREDRKEAEKRSAMDSHIVDRVVEAHEKRADDAKSAAAERERLARESADRLLSYERDRANRLEQELDAFREEVKTMLQQPRQSIASEVGEVLKMFPQPKDDSATTHLAETTIKDMQARHAEDMKRLTESHSQAFEATRASHAAEKQMLHETHRREIESERDAGRRREERIEDTLKIERDERRKDQDRHREQLEANDRTWKERLENLERAWKERMEQQKLMLETSFDARRQATEQNYENRIQYLQSELDRSKQDVADLRARGFEQSDPMAIVEKYRGLSEALGVTPGGATQPSGGGIGLSGDGGDSWKTMLAEGTLERLPMILETVTNLVKGPGQQGQGGAPQRQPQHGDVITENGVEYVIVNDNGQLKKARRDQYEAYQQAMQQRRQQRALPADTGPARRASRAAGPRRRRPDGGSPMPVPDLSIGLTPTKHGGVDNQVQEAMRKASEASMAGAGVQTPPQQQAAPTQQPQQEQHRRSRPRQEQQPDAPMEPSDGGALKMSTAERTALSYVAKWVHEAVSVGDSEEEFCVKLSNTVAPGLIKQVVTNYTPDAIAKAIVALQPNSAGATPAGQKFVHKAFALLRDQHSVEG